MSEPLGNPVVIATYVDANHAGNLANKRSHTGILIYVNNALIHWYSKWQNTESVVSRIATELIESLRHIL
jgi:hypothetical protein